MLVTAIRSVRAEMNISAGDMTPLVLAGASAEPGGARNAGTTWSSGWPGSPTFPSQITRRKVRWQLLVRGEVAALPLKGVIDLSARRRGSTRNWARPTPTSSGSMPSSITRNFVANAPEEIVEEEKEKREAAVARKSQDTRGAGAASKNAS